MSNKCCKICNMCINDNTISYTCGNNYHEHCIKTNKMSILNPKCPECIHGFLIINKINIDIDDEEDYTIPQLNVITIIFMCFAFILPFIFVSK